MNDIEAKAALDAFVSGVNSKVAKAALEKHFKDVEFQEEAKISRRADLLIAEKQPIWPPAGPSSEQVRNYITNEIDPALGISPPQA